MVSHESLSIAFICLSTQGEKESFLNDTKEFHKTWFASERGTFLKQAIELPNYYISDKIKYLQQALDGDQKGNKIREDMANRIAASCLKQFPPYLANSRKNTESGMEVM